MRCENPWRFEPTLRFLAFLPMVMALSGLAVEGFARTMVGTSEPRPGWLLGAGTGVLHLLMFGMVQWLVRAHGYRWTDAFGIFSHGWPKTWLRTAIWTLPAMIGAWILHWGCTQILDWFGISHDAQAAVDAVRRTSAIWERGLLFIFAVLTAPIMEEVLFRGILWPILRDRGWRVVGCVAVSALFALIHANAAALVPLLALGIFWTWLFEKTGDLTTPILSHAIFNGLNFAWLLISVAHSDA
ncbi:MAG: CPBP family intramembrane metalloprotease [Verrucomicrobiales bacterium]|nr:CPBP family intramembrane metalloprotease [Verrucomicrobiales bacterium]